jgi:phosphate transport system substrate-binding protein
MSHRFGRVDRPARARRLLALAAAALVSSASIHAGEVGERPGAVPAPYALEVVDSLPSYRPHAEVTGTIRLWGHGSPKHDFLGRLIGTWAREFHRYQPGVRIIDRMYGTASAIGALYTGAGNLAILGEELSTAERRAFERERHYAPTRIEIATGSLESNYFDYAHMVFVNRANPLKHLSLGRLAAIFGDRKGPGERNIRTWGELGLQGEWAHRRIHPYFWKVDQDFALFFQARVLDGSHQWNPHIRQFVTIARPDGTVDDRGLQILEALARDPAGIAVSNIRFAGPRVRALKLAATRAGPYVAATPRTLITERYPLTRIIPAYVDRAPGRPIEPAVREFLRFILSRQGQRALIEDSGYLPLGPSQIRRQLRKIAAMGPPLRQGVVARPRLQIPRYGPPAPGQPRHLAHGGAGSSVQPPVARTLLRVWGDPQLAALVGRWARGFRAGHPDVQVASHMTGSDTGMAGLYTGKADVALMGRAATDSELKAFAWVYRHPPLRVEILRGSLEAPGRSPALTVFVHRGNPLRRIDFAQLRGMFQARPPRGVPHIRTWGELGLTGNWVHRPIDLYVPDTDSGTGRFLRRTVLGGSALLDWRRITETARHPFQRDAKTPSRILRDLANDPDGLAIAWLSHDTGPVTPVPVSAHAAGPYLLPTAVTIREGRYPLGRAIYAYLDPGKSKPSLARQFLRYVLSAKGQAAVHAGEGFLPLPRKARLAGASALEPLSVASSASPVAEPISARSDESGGDPRRLPAQLQAYAPTAAVSGVIRIWGNPPDGPLIRALAAGFRRYQPRVRFLVTLHGPEATFAGVYMDVADLAFMPREIRVPLERMAFEWVHHYPPFTVEIANAGLGARHGEIRPGVNLAFFVNRTNPVSCLTLRQLDDVMAADHRRGGRNARRWAQLGATGHWARRPIHVYGPPLGNIAAVYIRHTVLAGSYKWNPGYREVGGGWRHLLEVLARDPDGIGFAPLLPGNGALKPLRLSTAAGRACVPLTARTAETRAYPLARTIVVALDRRPGSPIEPKVEEFLRYILSRQGQRIIARSGAYLPLDAGTQRRQLRRLK